MAVFADLPAEVRLQIWELCALPQQAVFAWGKPIRAKPHEHIPGVYPQVSKPRLPSAINTCAESRACMLSPAIAARYHVGQTHRPLDPALDVVYLHWPWSFRQMRGAIELAVKYGNPDPWPARIAHLAISPLCMNLRTMIGTDVDRQLLLTTLLCPVQRPRRLKEVSLVVGRADDDGEIDGSQYLLLAEWCRAGASSRSLDEVQDMRAKLASDLAEANRQCKEYRGEDIVNRPTISMKRIVRPGAVEAVKVRNWWKGSALAERVGRLARHWKGTVTGA